MNKKVLALGRSVSWILIALAALHFIFGKSLLITGVIGLILAAGYTRNSIEAGLSISERLGINRQIISTGAAIAVLMSSLVWVFLNPSSIDFSVRGVMIGLWILFGLWATFDSIQQIYQKSKIKIQ